MTTIARRTRLKADCIEEYERVHAVISKELDASLRAAGVTGYRIWRDGVDLLHLIDVVNFQRMQESLEIDPVHVAWQAQISRLLDADAGSAENLSLVWELPRPAMREPAFTPQDR